MALFTDLLVNLFASLIFFLAGLGVARAWRWCRLSFPLRRIWDLKPDADKHVSVQFIAATLTERVNRYDRPGTGMGEAKAYAVIRESLLDAYGNKVRLNFAFSYDYADQSNISLKAGEPHIISLGGPKYNGITEQFHRNFRDLPLYVDHADGEPVAIVDRRLNTRYEPTFFEEGNLTQDYGLVSRLPSDGGNSEVVIFLIEGIRTYGVAAAGQLMLPPLVKELHALVGKTSSDYWQALVSTQVGGASAAPVVIKHSFVALDAMERPLP